MKTIRHLTRLIVLVLIFSACQKSETDNSSENRLTNYSIPNYENIGEVDQENQTVKLQFGANVNLTSITPSIGISSGATIEPSNGETVDLTNPMEYVVTAADGSTRTYLVTATQFSDTALMIVDLQNGYFPFYKDNEIMDNTLSLITKARAASKHIIFIQTDYTSPNGQRDSPINTWDFEIPTALLPSPNDIYITKRNRDSFSETDLVPITCEKQIGSFVICGIATQYCLNATIVGGLRRGYRIIIAADAHSSYDPEAQLRIDLYNTEIWPGLGATVVNSNLIDF
jgi:nicotinamidase-related amidase